MATIDDITKRAAEIRDNIKPNSNTAELVGGVLNDLAGNLKVFEDEEAAKVEAAADAKVEERLADITNLQTEVWYKSIVSTNDIKIGTIYQGQAASDKTCLYADIYYQVEGGKTLNVYCASDLKIRVVQYDSDKTYIKDSGSYQVINSVTLATNALYVRIACSYASRGYSTDNPVTTDAYNSGDFCIYTSARFDIPGIKDDVEELQEEQIAKVQLHEIAVGSMYNGTPTASTSCLYDKLYYAVTPSSTITYNIADDIKVRVTQFNESKTVVNQSDYAHLTKSVLRSDAAYVRFAISYADRGYGDTNPISADVYADSDFSFNGTRSNILSSIESYVKDLDKSTSSSIDSINTELKVDLPLQSVNLGSLWNGSPATSSVDCLYDSVYYNVTPSSKLTFNVASDLTIRVTQYNSEKVFTNQTSWSHWTSVTLRSDTYYVRFAIGYGGRGYSSENPVSPSVYSSSDFTFSLKSKDFSFLIKNWLFEKEWENYTDAAITTLKSNLSITEVANAVDSHNNHVANSGICESFIFFTDPHVLDYSDNFDEAYFNKLINPIKQAYNANSVDFVVCGGDWLNNSDSQSSAIKKLSFQDVDMRRNFTKYYPVKGNHDTNYQGYKDETETTSWSGKLENQVLVNMMFRTEKLAYYEFYGNNTRCFVLDTMLDNAPDMDEYKWGEIDWFAIKLLTNTDEHIAVFLHIITNAEKDSFVSGKQPLYTNANAVAVAFNNRSSITLNDKTYDFASATGTVHFFMAGHSHYDYVDTTDTIPNIVTTTERDSGVATFDLCCADYTNNKLYLTRVGTGESREVNI